MAAVARGQARGRALVIARELRSLAVRVLAAKEIAFKTVETYSDGEVSRWIELPGGGAELEQPAPLLKLSPAAPGATPIAPSPTPTRPPPRRRARHPRPRHPRPQGPHRSRMPTTDR